MPRTRNSSQSQSLTPWYAVEMEENLDEAVAMGTVAVHLFARSVVAGNCTVLSATDLHDASLPRHTPSSLVLLTSGSGRWELHGAVSHGSPRCKSTETYTVFA